MDKNTEEMNQLEKEIEVNQQDKEKLEIEWQNMQKENKNEIEKVNLLLDTMKEPKKRAIEALNKIYVRDVSELMAFCNPPKAIVEISHVVLAMLGDNNSDWRSMKRMTSYAGKFLNTL